MLILPQILFWLRTFILFHKLLKDCSFLKEKIANQISKIYQQATISFRTLGIIMASFYGVQESLVKLHDFLVVCKLVVVEKLLDMSQEHDFH